MSTRKDIATLQENSDFAKTERDRQHNRISALEGTGELNYERIVDSVERITKLETNARLDAQFVEKVDLRITKLATRVATKGSAQMVDALGDDLRRADDRIVYLEETIVRVAAQVALQDERILTPSSYTSTTTPDGKVTYWGNVKLTGKPSDVLIFDEPTGVRFPQERRPERPKPIVRPSIRRAIEGRDPGPSEFWAGIWVGALCAWIVAAVLVESGVMS